MIYSAIVSCFDANGCPNAEATRMAVEHNIVRSGVDGLFINGSTGENHNMRTSDKKAIIKTITETAGDRAACIAHIGTNVIEEFIELARFSADCGCKAVSATAPVYFGYTQEGYVNYFTTLADNSPLPLYVYNIPARTHVHLTRESFKKIFSHPNITGIKFTDTDLGLFGDVRKDNPHIDLLSGYDNLLLPYTALGADGSIGTGYNICARMAREVFDLTRSGNLEAARKRQNEMNEIMDLLITPSIIQVVKAVMELYGVPCGECRFPQPKISDADRETAKAIYDLIEKYMPAEA